MGAIIQLSSWQHYTCSASVDCGHIAVREKTVVTKLYSSFETVLILKGVYNSRYS